jgi:hypothetical protein
LMSPSKVGAPSFAPSRRSSFNFRRVGYLVSGC